MPSILQVEGGHPLREITVRGAKNFVPKAKAVVSLLADTSEPYNVRRPH